MEDFIDRKAISSRLKQILDESGMNAKEFAILTDISQATLSQVITGKSLINLESINKVIAHAKDLDGFDISWFLFGGNNGIDIPADGVKGAGSRPLVADFGKAIEQAEELGKLRQRLEQSKPKEIERIVVFYTDNSIATYTLQQ